MNIRSGHFEGDDPFEIVRQWIEAAGQSEPNDPCAAALATVDSDGLPNARMVLLRGVDADGFVFYTNFGSAKAKEIDASGRAAFVMHWKSLRRQIRARGAVGRVEDSVADSYFASRPLQSRYGAWASRQSQPLASRQTLLKRVAELTVQLGMNPDRPSFWGGYRLRPLEIEFWSDGAFRLHDRFQWKRASLEHEWRVTRLSP